MVLWYSFFMLAAVVYYSHVRWKEDSHLIRVYNSLFVYPSSVPVTRQTYNKNGQQVGPGRVGGGLLHSKHFDRKLPEYLMEGIDWQPFDPQTGRYRYKYDTRYPSPDGAGRTRESMAWLGLGNLTGDNTGDGGRTLFKDVFLPDGFTGNLSDYLSAMKLYQETIEKVIKARTNPEAPGSTPLTIPDPEQLELGRKLVLSTSGGQGGAHQDPDGLQQTNSSVLLAAIEENMQQIRRETELSLQRLAELNNILNNAPNGSMVASSKDSLLLGQLRLNASRLHQELLLGKSGLNLNLTQHNASLHYMLGLQGPDTKREQNMQMSGVDTIAEKPMQRAPLVPPKDQLKTAPERPGLWGYLTGGGPVLKQEDVGTKTGPGGSGRQGAVGDKSISATRKAAETVKIEGDPDIIQRPPTQMPEVEGYYVLETRTVR